MKEAPPGEPSFFGYNTYIFLEGGGLFPSVDLGIAE